MFLFCQKTAADSKNYKKN